MTYRVVKIEPCENDAYCVKVPIPRCLGCRGDGTRMVEVAVVEPDDWSDVGIPKPVWVEVES